MIGFFKKLFGSKTAEATQPEAAPYKVETPVVAEPAPVAEQASQAMVESVAPLKILVQRNLQQPKSHASQNNQNNLNRIF